MTSVSRRNDTQATSSQTGSANREIVVTRTLDAPRELVWQAWTDPAHLIHWWGPRGFTNTLKQFDLRPGGVWRFAMHGPDGVDYPNQIVFQEIEAPARLVALHGSGAEDDPDRFEMIVTLEEEQANQTRLTLRMVFPSAAARDQAIKEYGAIDGANQTLDRLAERVALLLADDPAARELVITRMFNASRELVWQAWTDPAHIAQWFGPKGFTTRVDGQELRPGGHWRYVMIGPDGTEYPAEGVFREVVPMERIVTTDEFGEDYDMPGMDLPRGIVVTETFDDLGSQTRLTLRIAHRTVEDRRKHEAMGVVAGWESSFECLDVHLATLITP
jgi:uncharacterized protein YndB with AHSA1/START domain